MYSDIERTAHVVRRLGIGANPSLVSSSGSPEDAISGMMSLPGTPASPPMEDPPEDRDSVDYELLSHRLIPWWVDSISSGLQPLTERLVWFWHDHFAVSGEKVDNSYILWKHHRLVRDHATGNYADLLRAMAKDPAMLWYLDAVDSTADTPNENLGRELMELHTLGLGNYTQNDVREVSRALTGWVINEPRWEEAGFVYPDAAPWSAVLEADRHDTGTKNILGTTGDMDLDDVVDLLLQQPETGQFIAGKLYKEIVGLDPAPATVQRLGKKFAGTYEIMELVEEIVADPAFVSDEAVRAKVRTPLEKAATVLQGLPHASDVDPSSLTWMLSKLHYLPLHAPNPAGFPAGDGLLDPARILGSFELLYLAESLDDADAPTVDPLAALGLYDVSTETRALLDRFPRPGLQLGLAFGSPEFMVV